MLSSFLTKKNLSNNAICYANNKNSSTNITGDDNNVPVLILGMPLYSNSIGGSSPGRGGNSSSSNNNNSNSSSGGGGTSSQSSPSNVNNDADWHK